MGQWNACRQAHFAEPQQHAPRQAAEKQDPPIAERPGGAVNNAVNIYCQQKIVWLLIGKGSLWSCFRT